MEQEGILVRNAGSSTNNAFHVLLFPPGPAQPLSGCANPSLHACVPSHAVILPSPRFSLEPASPASLPNAGRGPQEALREPIAGDGTQHLDRERWALARMRPVRASQPEGGAASCSLIGSPSRDGSAERQRRRVVFCSYWLAPVT